MQDVPGDPEPPRAVLGTAPPWRGAVAAVLATFGLAPGLWATGLWWTCTETSEHWELVLLAMGGIPGAALAGAGAVPLAIEARDRPALAGAIALLASAGAGVVAAGAWGIGPWATATVLVLGVLPWAGTPLLDRAVRARQRHR